MPTKKKTEKKPPAKKATSKKAPAKKTAAKKPAAKKPATKKASAKKPATKKSAAKKSPAKKSAAKKTVAKRKAFTKKELKVFEDLLWELRERITDEISFLSGDNVKGSSGNDIDRNNGDAGDQGSVNFDREFALNLMSSEQDVIYEIDEALQRIKDGTYGICEMTGNPIERERLKAIPYARYSVAAKTELEREQAGRIGRR